jgi:hypothetical protein
LAFAAATEPIYWRHHGTKAEVATLQANYQTAMADYQARGTIFQTESQAVQGALATRSIERSAAVSKAEGLLDRFHEDSGWAFVDKEDGEVFWPRLMIAWGAPAGMIAGLFLITLLAISQRT